MAGNEGARRPGKESAMDDRTSIELRLAAHRARVERVDREAWKHQRAVPARRVRERLAAALVAPATRLPPALPLAGVAHPPLGNGTQTRGAFPPGRGAGARPCPGG